MPELLEAGSGALLDELDAIIPHISGGSTSVEDFVAKKKAVGAAHQDNPRHVQVRKKQIRQFFNGGLRIAKEADRFTAA